MLISVIIPVYRVEDTLERAVDSVRQQTYQQIEIILVDDGSPDRSGQIAENLAKEDSRIRVIHKENGGLSSARNAGLDVAKGDFVAFLDSDDEFCPHLMEDFYHAYQDHGMDLYVFNLRRIYLDQRKSQDKKAIDQLFQNSKEALKALFQYDGLDFYAWNKIYSRHLFDDIRYPEGKIYEDGRVSYATTVKADKVLTTSKIGINYYENQDSIVAQAFNPQQMDNVTEREWVLNDMLAKHYDSDLIDLAAARLYDGVLSTAFKLAQSPDRLSIQTFDQQLKQTVKLYQPLFKRSPYLSTLKKAAWQVYKLNQSLYKYLYYYYKRF